MTKARHVLLSQQTMRLAGWILHSMSNALPAHGCSGWDVRGECLGSLQRAPLHWSDSQSVCVLPT